MNTVVSIITPVLNATSIIEKCILSIQQQTYPHIEHIIIDGNSIDGTVDIIKKYNSVLAYWHSKPDLNTTQGFNEGLKKISPHSNLVGFLNADDWFEPSAIQQVVELFNKTNSDIIYAPIKIHDKNGPIQVVKPLEFSKWKKEMYYQLPVPHIGTFIKTDVIRKIGFFNEIYSFAADHEYFIKMMQSNCSAFYLESIVGNARIHGKAHGFKALMEKWKIASTYNAPFFTRVIKFTKYGLCLILGKILIGSMGRKIFSFCLKFFGSRHATV